MIYYHNIRSNHDGVKEMGGSLSVYENGPIRKMDITCDAYCCYRKCRLDMVGGGRCTAAGCLCYESFFIENPRDNETFGAPAAIVYPQDRIWYHLNYTETDQIKNAMRHYFRDPKATNYMCEKE